MKNKNLIGIFMVAVLSLGAYAAGAQGMAVNTTGAAANSSAILDVQSTTQGMLVPKMTTTQRTSISSPATGLLVWDNTIGGFYFYSGSAWVSLSSPTGTISSGDLTGSYPNPTISSSASTGNDIITAINASAGGLSGTQLAALSVSVNAMSATGTRNSTTFLRGDNTWATPSGGGTSHGCQTYCFTGVITTFTVPTGITSVTITATGGNGGSGPMNTGNDPGTLPGLGAMVTGTIAVTAGHVLDILVGSGGDIGTYGDGGGGGGGTFIWDASAGNALLVAAGGGGGACDVTGSSGGNGQSANGSAATLEAAVNGVGGNGANGTGGGGSSAGATGTGGGGTGAGAGGCGWGASSAAVTGTYPCGAGIYPLAGATPGQGGAGYAGGGANGYGGEGGYGGGGGGGYYGGGGGGGYNGGGGGNASGDGAAGGGSYFNGTTATSTGLNYYGAHNGSVVITW